MAQVKKKWADEQARIERLQTTGENDVIRYAPCGDPVLPGIHDDEPCGACMNELHGPFEEMNDDQA